MGGGGAAKQLDSREDIYLLGEPHGSMRFCIWLLVFTSLSRETVLCHEKSMETYNWVQLGGGGGE